ncbi:MAG: hypothetical protein IPN78_16705 [Candidatus Accumulibacter sp.]|nr:hypothetical protein [Candidatus Accumulibacter propinquus]
MSVQCLQVSEVQAALLLLEQGGGTFVPAAVWPAESVDVGYLAPAAQQCLSERQGKVLRGQAGAVVVVAYPVELDGDLQEQWCSMLPNATTSVAGRSQATALGNGWIQTLLLRRHHLDDAQTLQRARSAPRRRGHRQRTGTPAGAGDDGGERTCQPLRL